MLACNFVPTLTFGLQEYGGGSFFNKQIESGDKVLVFTYTDYKREISSVFTLVLAGSPSVMVGRVEGLWIVKLARVPSLSSSFWAWN